MAKRQCGIWRFILLFPQNAACYAWIIPMKISRLTSATLAALDVSQADLSILFGPAGSGKTSLARGAPRAIFGSSDETLTTPLSPVEVETSGATRYIRSGKRPDQSEASKWIDWAGHSRSLKAA